MHGHMNVKIGYCVIYSAPTQVSIKEQASYSAKQKCHIFCEYEKLWSTNLQWGQSAVQQGISK